MRSPEPPNRHLAASNAGIPAIPPGVQLVTLPNGLTLIVREDHSAPVVSAQAWCRAGSIDEGSWMGAGLSHILEHMLFKGTSRRGPGRIDQEVQEQGGYINAYTSFDRTVYWINVPSPGAQTAIDILCDIMQNASLPADELLKEKQVILREMDMNHDDPGRRSSRRLFETAYTRSPYRYTVIGYPDIFNQVTPETVVTYYREKYVPNNLFFVVVGDIQAEAVVRQISEAFSGVGARPLAPTVLPEEPRQIAGREILEEGPIQLGHFHMAWHIPELRHPDVPALDVLATLLGNGRSSRLYQQVRERKALVHSIDAWTYNPGNPGLFGVSGIVDPERFEAAAAAIQEEITRMQDSLVPFDELNKALKQFTAGTLASRKTMEGQAQDLGGSWLATQDLNFSARYLAAVQRLTPQDLQRVAREYLADDNRTLYALLPEGALPKRESEADLFSDHPIEKHILPNGLTLLLKESHRLPFVEIRAVLQGGLLVETPENNGITQLAAKLLLKGTSSRSAEQIVTEVESVGGTLETYGGNNSFGVSAEVLSSDLITGLQLVADVLLNPTFPAEALDREREVQLSIIQSQKDHLLQRAGSQMRRRLFGARGYGLDAIGSETSVSGLRREQLAAFHQSWVQPGNCVLAVFGDVDPAVVRAAVENAFGAWNGTAPGWKPEASHPPSQFQRVTERLDKKQAVLVVGFQGTTLHHPDRFALELLQEACSDLGSRLFLRIRENLGLAYFVGAQNVLGRTPGYFAFYVGTAPEKADLVEEELLREADLLAREGLSREELQRAKAKILGQKKIARQDLGHLATATALDELYGLGYAASDTEDARYEAVTEEEVRQVASRYLRREAAVSSVVLPIEDRAS